MKRKPKNILQELIKKREENILLLSKWPDEDIKEMVKRYREARETAYEQDNFKLYKILINK